jgi:sigma-B regulation protein RsbU (phosphoserine phosphatase)
MEQLEQRPMQTTFAIRDASLHDQLKARRARLAEALPLAPASERLQELIREVDGALERMTAGTYGLCETCHDPIENDRLLANPLCRYCIDHLSPSEQRALELDLGLAFEVQRGLLPKSGMTIDGWTMAYHYQPAGPVSGDYCDLIDQGDGTGIFIVGDVTGKGVAASMLMAQLYAIFRSLVPLARSPGELLVKANRIFCDGTLSSYFATVVCGRIGKDGDVEIANAGHCLPYHVSSFGVLPVPSTGMPLGIFNDADYGTRTVKLAPGDSLLLYSDGWTEALNGARQQYGKERLAGFLKRKEALPADVLLNASLEELRAFRDGAAPSDDLTIMVLRREN